MTQFIQVITTIDKKETAKKIAENLLKKKLVSCVQIAGPVTSAFWWHGEIDTDEEYLCICKSREDLFNQVEEAIKEIHTYDVPEILAIPVSTGNIEYLNWMSEELKNKQ
ncbi:MAG: divalent-cation tolerance protein CutA [Spirochaetota bacterium]